MSKYCAQTRGVVLPHTTSKTAAWCCRSFATASRTRSSAARVTSASIHSASVWRRRRRAACTNQACSTDHTTVPAHGCPPTTTSTAPYTTVSAFPTLQRLGHLPLLPTGRGGHTHVMPYVAYATKPTAPHVPLQLCDLLLLQRPHPQAT